MKASITSRGSAESEKSPTSNGTGCEAPIPLSPPLGSNIVVRKTDVATTRPPTTTSWLSLAHRSSPARSAAASNSSTVGVERVPIVPLLLPAPPSPLPMEPPPLPRATSAPPTSAAASEPLPILSTAVSPLLSPTTAASLLPPPSPATAVASSVVPPPLGPTPAPPPTTYHHVLFAPYSSLSLNPNLLECRGPPGDGQEVEVVDLVHGWILRGLYEKRGLSEERVGQRDIHGFGGACRSLALYEALPSRVRELVDAAGFGEFIRTLTLSRNDHVVLVALAERCRDTTNTFHLPLGEMTVTPTDFAAITGRSKVHLSYLPALRDLRTASRFDWGGTALGAAYGFLGESSRTEQSTADYWRVWEINMDPWRAVGPEPEYLARSRAVTASRVLLESAFSWQWYLGDRVMRQSLGYADFQVPGPLPPRASHTSTYTRAELERFTQPDTEMTRYLHLEMDYTVYQRDRLARPLGVRAFRDVRSHARGAAEERRATRERERGGEGRVRRSLSRPVIGLEMSWKIPVVGTQGNPAEIHLVPARVEPPSMTIPAQGHAASTSKRTRSPPQNKMAMRMPTPPVTTRRQTRSSQPAAASEEAVRQTVARAELQYQIKMCERPSHEEGRAQKRPRLILPEISEEEEEEGDEEEEEHSSARSDSDDSVDDPPYKKDPKERGDDDDDDSGRGGWLG
ncbi:hypothetical protein RHMOL_Rhmol10G0180500 [Rhododendron molle]|uniref:Uncharacterized protein n=1 Tax=Rhododendron molle TaxID=49168 RepID=A0ACC0M3S6_RHOML|nr:hypothetical protein RHMOL_Rhmol10G0180500 [Rhododendron molle]